jgi:transposase InsO family protein
LEGDCRGTRGGLRGASEYQLRSRRSDLHRHALPAPFEPRQHLAHPQGGRAEPASPAFFASAKGTGKFQDYHLGFIHIDIKQLPMLRTADGERRKRYRYVAIDRCSRSVHLAVKDDMTTKSAAAFLREAAAFPFRITHVLTDNGSCFSPAIEKVCAELGAQYHHTRPYTPQTNGMVE